MPATVRLEAVFCGLHDHARGGSFTVAPDEVVEARQRYEPDTAVLVTELRSPTGLVAVTDALALRPGTDLSDDAPAGRRELIRSAVVLDGAVRLWVEIDPRGGALAHRAAAGLAVEPLESLRSAHELQAGDRLEVVLSWADAHRHHRFGAEDLLASTARSWRRWMERFHYHGPEAPLVRRAALTLKLCDHWRNGALVAAPTSSLPAPIGGVRNWDYRYAWIRNASCSVYTLRRIGFGEEAGAFLGWVLDTFEHGSAPKIMYSLDGGAVPDERVDSGLEGYRRSAPVRFGNGAADQLQHDVTARCSTALTVGQRGRSPRRVPLGAAGFSGRPGGRRLAPARPGHLGGAQRGPGVHLLGGAVPGGARPCGTARADARPARAGCTWRRAADDLRDAILEQSWNEAAQTLSAQLYGGGDLDASLLALPSAGSSRQTIPGWLGGHAGRPLRRGIRSRPLRARLHRSGHPRAPPADARAAPRG